MSDSSPWPDIPYPAWRDTALTLQLWTQIVGKIRLAQTPWLNHGWQVPLYVTARGLGTSPIPVGHALLEIEFDFLAHRLLLRTSMGTEREFALRPRSVADFHDALFAALGELGLLVVIDGVPNEVADPIPFAQDHVHASYDADAAHRFWRALIQADRVLRLFRSAFLGKASPIHYRGRLPMKPAPMM